MGRPAVDLLSTLGRPAVDLLSTLGRPAVDLLSTLGRPAVGLLPPWVDKPLDITICQEEQVWFPGCPTVVLLSPHAAGHYLPEHS